MNGGLRTLIRMKMLPTYWQSLYLQGRSERGSFGCYYIIFKMYEERIMTDPLGSNLFFTYAFAISFLFFYFSQWGLYYGTMGVPSLQFQNCEVHIWLWVTTVTTLRREILLYSVLQKTTHMVSKVKQNQDTLVVWGECLQFVLCVVTYVWVCMTRMHTHSRLTLS